MDAFSWGDATWVDLSAIDPARLVAILPLGAVEAHGPHLPLVTDRVIARAMARQAAVRLAEGSLEPRVLPGLDYTAAPFAAAFPGTLSLRPATVTALVVDVGTALAELGARCLALANAHLDPAHLASLHQAVEELRGRIRVAFPDLTRRPWAQRLSEEFRTGACHAGRYESSVVMAERPDLVRDEVRRGLAPNPASLSEAIGAGHRTFAEAGGPQAYFGWPAEATAREGEETVARLAGILVEAVLAALAQ